MNVKVKRYNVTNSSKDRGAHLPTYYHLVCQEDPTVTVKGRTDNVTNKSKGRGTHSFILNRQMI